MREKILITGGCGFIGFHLVMKLRKTNKYNIIVVDNLSSDNDLIEERFIDNSFNFEHLKKHKCYEGGYYLTFIKNDIKDYDAMKKIFKKYNFKYVINLAALPGVSKSNEMKEEYSNNNINGFKNIFNLCKEYKIEHLLYASSSSVYGDTENIESNTLLTPISFYALTKLMNEVIASCGAEDGMKVSGMRLFTTYGRYQRKDMALQIFANKIKEGEILSLYNFGDNKRDFIHVDDVTDGILAILTSNIYYDHEVFNIGSGVSVSTYKFMSFIGDIIDKNYYFEYCEKNSYDVVETKADIIKMKDYFGWEPKIKLKKGIKSINL